VTDDQIKKAFDALQCQIEMQKAEIRVIRLLLGRICELTGLTEIESHPIPQWMKSQLVAELEKALIAIEDKNPARAAQMQAILDEAKRRADGSRS